MHRVYTLFTALLAALLVWLLVGCFVLGLLGVLRSDEFSILSLLGSVLAGAVVWYAVSIARNVGRRRG